MATKKPLTGNYFLKNCSSIQKSVSATTTTTKKALKTDFLHDAENFSHSAITMTCFDDYVYKFEKKNIITFSDGRMSGVKGALRRISSSSSFSLPPLMVGMSPVSSSPARKLMPKVGPG
jgi:hypothetical protein